MLTGPRSSLKMHVVCSRFLHVAQIVGMFGRNGTGVEEKRSLADTSRLRKKSISFISFHSSPEGLKVPGVTEFPEVASSSRRQLHSYLLGIFIVSHPPFSPVHRRCPFIGRSPVIGHAALASSTEKSAPENPNAGRRHFCSTRS